MFNSSTSTNEELISRYNQVVKYMYGTGRTVCAICSKSVYDQKCEEPLGQSLCEDHFDRAFVSTRLNKCAHCKEELETGEGVFCDMCIAFVVMMHQIDKGDIKEIAEKDRKEKVEAIKKEFNALAVLDPVPVDQPTDQ